MSAGPRAHRTVYTMGVSVRLVGRFAPYLHLATGRYWTWGGTFDRHHVGVRLPFLSAGWTRITIVRPRLRVTFMGWRGADHAPSPAFREWHWRSPITQRDATMMGVALATVEKRGSQRQRDTPGVDRQDPDRLLN